MQLALHTVSYAGVWPGQARLDLPDVIRRAASLGFTGVEIVCKRPHLSVLDTSPESLADLRALLSQNGVRAACLAGYTNFTADAAHPDIPLVEMQIAYVTELARLAKALGGSVIRLFTGYEDPALSPGQTRERIVSALRECARRVADHGCTLAVQNHHDFACDYRSLRDLLLEVDEPACRAAFDAWAPALQGTDLYESARELAPLNAWTTCADYQLRPRFRYRPELVNYDPLTPATFAVPMGEGIIDYPAFFRGLRDGGYDGWVAYEMCSPLEGGGSLENLDRCATRFVEYMKEIH
jgi:sugar phosphate isomerase/epimerase